MGEEIKYKPMLLTADIVMVENNITKLEYLKMVVGLFAAACLFPFVLVFMVLFRRDELK